MKNLKLKKILEESKKRSGQQFVLEEFCFDKQLEFINDKAKFKTAVCSRRCLKEGTLVKTPKGSIPIQNLKIGDEVFGYNEDKSISIVKITKVWNQGEQKVVDLIHNNRVLATCTEDHKWLFENSYNNKLEKKSINDINCRDNLAEVYTPVSIGEKSIEFAYALGALIGDGCSRESGVNISSEDNLIPNIVSSQLGYKVTRNSDKNYTWRLNGSNYKDSQLKLYNKWCRNKYAHEKFFDINEVRSWNRESQLEFIAGLIDTDGSVSTTEDGRLVIRLAMQAKSVIDNVSDLLLDLFQVQVTRRIDNREKYKNGPIYELCISNNKYSKRILKELPTKVLRKQWKDEYNLLNERNSHPNRVGFKIKNPHIARTYDITVDNSTNLFILANGLISSNSGKSVSCAADLMNTALTIPKSTSLYITLSRVNAKRIIWKELLSINRDFKLGARVNETELSLTFDNDSIIYCSGAKDNSEIEKFRGLALHKVYIDEAQSFRSYIRELIDDVLVPALWDNDGSLIMIGTPGPIAAGPFYESCHSKAWSNHKWTIHNNPFIQIKSGKTPEQILKAERERRGIDETDPTYRRESLGEWVQDLDALVFKYDKLKNDFDTLPEGKWHYIFGIDLGLRDADAIAVIAYSYENPNVYLVQEFIKSNQDITSLVDKIKELENKYKPVKMKIDHGGLGAKIAEELRVRHKIPVEAAEKVRKFEFIELMNDDLRLGKLKIKSDTRWVEDQQLVSWDYSNPDKLKISDTYHSDITDAVLYAWREAKHYHQIRKEKPLDPTSEAAVDKFWEREEKRLKEKEKSNWWEEDE